MIGLILLISLFGCASAVGHTKMCAKCDRVKDPASCHLVMKCGRGEQTCFTRVEYISGEYLYSKGCAHECVDQPASLIIGKRGPHEPHAHHPQMCQDCCSGPECPGCGVYVAGTTSKPMTTPAPVTAAPPATAAPATPCMDHETDGFVCADYDSYNFCTDTNSLAHKLAVDRCPQHCGLCDANGNFKVTPSPSVSLTDSPTDANTAQPIVTDTPSMSMTSSMPMVTATDVQLVSINVTTCMDKEDQGFSCQQWASYGFCSDGTGTGHAIAVERCSKYCGFCS